MKLTAILKYLPENYCNLSKKSPSLSFVSLRSLTINYHPVSL